LTGWVMRQGLAPARGERPVHFGARTPLGPRAGPSRRCGFRSVDPAPALRSAPMAGGEAASRRSKDGEATPAVATFGLTRRFDALVAVDHLDLTVKRGAFFGLLGSNGAGKSTAVRMFTRPPRIPMAQRMFMVPPSSRGEGGRLPSGAQPDEGRENLLLSARLYGIPRAERARRVEQALAFMGLDEVAEGLVRTYSGGMIRRLEIAQAMLHRSSAACSRCSVGTTSSSSCTSSTPARATRRLPEAHEAERSMARAPRLAESASGAPKGRSMTAARVATKTSAPRTGSCTVRASTGSVTGKGPVGRGPGPRGPRRSSSTDVTVGPRGELSREGSSLEVPKGKRSNEALPRSPRARARGSSAVV